MNHAIVNLIADQFWTVKGDGVRMGKTNNKYLSFPDPLLAACASGVSPFIPASAKLILEYFSVPVHSQGLFC
jgi:hypothetical protein